MNTETPAIPAPSSTHKRVAWIDFARYFAMIFICETHSGMHLIRGNGLWAGAGVFIFFFLAGYFCRKKGSILLKRCAILFTCAVFWAFIKACIIRHGLHFTLQEFVFEHSKFRGTMWFLQYLVLWMLLSPLYRAIPYRLLKNAIPYVLIILFLLSCFHATDVSSLHISYSASSGMFYMGMSMQDKKPECIFSCIKQLPPRVGSLMTGTLLLALLVVSYFIGNNHGILFALFMLFSLAYLILAMSFFVAAAAPNFAELIAKMGAATIFIYVCHAAIFHAWTGGYIAVFHSFPPVYLTLLLALVILLFGPLFYYKTAGKNKLLDILLFAK